MSETMEFQKAQIDALQKEVMRLKNELLKVKEMAFKIRLHDPNFDKKLSEIEVDYQIVKK